MPEKDKLLAVIRVRGRVKVRQAIAETLGRLRLGRVNNLVLINSANPSYSGMLKKCKDYVTFGEIDKETLVKLLSAKGAKLDEPGVSVLLSGVKSAKELGLEMPFGMHPPRKGYEGIKKAYRAGGALGNRGAEINKLIARML